MKLCINADDFGLSEDINAGILDCMEYGVVSSCSVMATEPASKQICQLKGQDNISVGLHFTLTEANIPLHSEKITPLKLAFRYALGQFSEKELSAEVERQFNILDELLGRKLSHIDSHQHIHVLPKARRVMNNLAKSKGIAYVRSPRERSPDISVKQIFLNLAFAFDNSEVDFFGINLMGRRFTRENVARQFEYLKKRGTKSAIWMVHVGNETKSGQGNVHNNAQRQHELDVLKDLRSYIQNQATIVPLEALL
jgi:predicted glycoside hydrolase/deacetylase ChbG (UPF0249 family)